MIMDKDLLVIGGGINGTGIAADAAGRGLSVVLCEMGDLASGTSSASSKLIHGGLRYLENADFALVRESLSERKILSRLAPHLIKQQAFVMPHCPWLRPYWVIRSGMFIYDFLSNDRKIPNSKALNRAEIQSLELKQQYQKALQYYDCTEDDSRLVLHVALLARQHGAEILPRTKLVKAVRKKNGWLVSLLHDQDLKVYNVKSIVNTSGPWVQQVATELLNIKPKYNVRLVKGSHIVVPKLFDHNKAFILQNKDNRVVFVIPYMQNFTLIGTTDILLNQVEHPVTVSNEEMTYLCDITNQFLLRSISPSDVIYKYAGIRALHDQANIEPSKLSRDYVLDINEDEAEAPVISVFGGKITTYRSLAEHVGNRLLKYFPRAGKAWTKKAYLPGGYFPNDDVTSFTKHIHKNYAPIPESLLSHYINTYGTRTVEVLMNSHRLSDLGQHFGGDLYQREVDYLVQNEWAVTAEDILWRRGKQGLFLTPEETKKLENYLSAWLAHVEPQQLS
jgi:glycerol-3-phosphate dehydrogenase